MLRTKMFMRIFAVTIPGLLEVKENIHSTGSKKILGASYEFFELKESQ
jgi:hypothetical protein